MKPIYNYENYLIDEKGNVYNTNTRKFLQGSISESGYKYYRLSKNNSKKMFYAHRLVAEHFINNPKNLPIVNHIDGNKLNNCIDNLEWVSYSENIEHFWKNISTKQRKPREYYELDLPNEIWKEFGNYYVSSKGRVRHKKGNILSPSLISGYYKVRLSENGLTKDYLVHKLVYQMFKEDYEQDSSKVIDHIDGNKLNNEIENLRLISLSENVVAALYETKTNSSAKRVEQYDLSGKLINCFESARQAADKLNLDSSTISKVCRGKNKTHGGFIFKYSN